MTTREYAIWLFLMGLGFIGALLIVYSFYGEWTGERLPTVEKWAPFLSAFLTLLGTLVTAGSVYFPTTIRPPYRPNKIIVSPLVMLGSITAIILLFNNGQLPAILVSGFGLLAISGALLRLAPTPANET
jgi:hypothetical protein